MLYIILAAIALLGIGGLSSCAYKKGYDSREQEVQTLKVAEQSAIANVAQRDQIISTQNDALGKIASVGRDAKALAQTAIAQSKAREAAERSRRDSLEAIARSGGTETAQNCPKTASTLGDLSDIMRGDLPVATAPAVTPPVPVATPAKQLPPAIRVKP